jgi:hypothetical protein
MLALTNTLSLCYSIEQLKLVHRVHQAVLNSAVVNKLLEKYSLLGDLDTAVDYYIGR